MSRFENRMPVRHAETAHRHAGCRILRGASFWVVKRGNVWVGEAESFAEAEMLAEAAQRKAEAEAVTLPDDYTEHRMREAENHGAADKFPL